MSHVTHQIQTPDPKPLAESLARDVAMYEFETEVVTMVEVDTTGGVSIIDASTDEFSDIDSAIRNCDELVAAGAGEWWVEDRRTIGNWLRSILPLTSRSDG